MTRYWYSYGRFALVDALLLAHVRPGDHVLLPSFICRDVLAAVRELGALPEWYRVPQSLTITDSTTWPTARAVIAVNYFGFPQNLEPFLAYAQRTGAVLIEDNAHGWLSSDPTGAVLGERTALGMTSVRKTVRSVDGAFLSVGEGVRIDPSVALPGPNDMDIRRVAVGTYIRRWVSAIERATKLPLMNAMRYVIRRLRGAAGRAPIPNDDSLEYRLPTGRHIHRSSRRLIDRVDTNAEISRRRNLYVEVGRRLRHVTCTPIFPDLPPGTCPQGFPIIADDDHLADVRRALRGTGLELMSWPDLPHGHEHELPHYSQVYLVNFL